MIITGWCIVNFFLREISRHAGHVRSVIVIAAIVRNRSLERNNRICFVTFR